MLTVAVSRLSHKWIVDGVAIRGADNTLHKNNTRTRFYCHLVSKDVIKSHRYRLIVRTVYTMGECTYWGFGLV